MASRRKASLRAEAAALRRSVWLTAGAAARQALAGRGTALIGAMRDVTVASGYFPVRDEIDPLPLLEALHDNGVRLALPVTIRGPSLVFRAWVPGTALRAARYGLQEPGDTNPELFPNLVLLPLLAFDRSGNRLGYGAGYYDAALRNLRRRGPVTAIGIGFDEQELAEIPQEPHDEPLDMILTPSRVIYCGA